MNARKKKQGLVAALPERLLPWYRERAGALPWRRDQAPSSPCLRLSEIMLQQTPVEAVLGYYSRFLETCPDIPALAACPPEVLNKLWQGLGYDTRVRNLQKAAQCICRDYGGEFPRDIAAIRGRRQASGHTRPGLSRRSALSSRKPAVDGNVLRVTDAACWPHATPLERPAATACMITQALAAVYPAGRCGAFTQSLMGLGALVCLPNGAPLCGQRPLQALCRASAAGNPCAYPVRAPKADQADRGADGICFLLRRSASTGKAAARGASGPGCGSAPMCWESCRSPKQSRKRSSGACGPGSWKNASNGSIFLPTSPGV